MWFRAAASTPVTRHVNTSSYTREQGGGWIIVENEFTRLILVAAILVYIVYGVMAFYTFQNLPPILDKAVTETGELLFTSQDVVEGKVLVQRYGLQDYGSFLGFGGYFGMDYTAYTLHILAETAKDAGIEDLKAALEPRFEQQGGETIAVVSDVFAEGYHRALDFYTRFFRGEVAQETKASTARPYTRR